MGELTLQMLKDFEPGIFAGGIYLSSRWVAVRGGIHDWAIYIGTPDRTPEDIRSYGDKVHDETTIRKLVPCSDEAFAMYRH